MQRKVSVERPDPRRDGPEPLRLVVLSVLGLSLGVLAARGTLVSSGPPFGPGTGDSSTAARAGDPSRGMPVSGAAGRTAGDAGVVPVVAQSPPHRTFEAEASPARPEDAGSGRSPDASPSPPGRTRAEAGASRSPDAGGGRRIVHPGRVAYLRCEGAEGAGVGPFPCPRDRLLERSVWALLRALPDCDVPPTGAGQADLRITFRPGQTPAIEVRAEAPGIDRSRVSSCLAGPLSSSSTSIVSDYLLVSFRFDLVAGD